MKKVLIYGSLLAAGVFAVYLLKKRGVATVKNEPAPGTHGISPEQVSSSDNVNVLLDKEKLNLLKIDSKLQADKTINLSYKDPIINTFPTLDSPMDRPTVTRYDLYTKI